MDNQNEKLPNTTGKEEDPYEDYEIRDHSNTLHDHFYIEDPQQDPNSELLSVMCTGCPSGCNIEPDKFKIVEGKIVSKNS